MKNNGKDLNVLLVSVSDQVGGTEQVIKMLASGLNHRGARCEILTSGGNNREWLSESGAKVGVAPELRPPYGGKLLGTLKLAQKFRRFRDGVINIHYALCEPYSRHYMAIKLSGCKRAAISVHHPGIRLHESAERVKSIMMGISPVIVTTPALAQFLAKSDMVRPDQLVVILPGVTPQTPVPKPLARKTMNLPYDGYIVGSMSRVDGDKRLPLLIDTVRRCHEKGQKAHLVIGGRGSESEAVAAYGLEQLGDSFTMAGWVQDSNAFYSSLDACVLLSEVEGFGLVYAEAAGHSVPSIGCRAGGIAYAIDEGVTGGLVDSADPVEPASSLLALWASDAQLSKKLGENARQRYEKLFTFDRMLDDYIGVFHRLPDYQAVGL